MQTSLVELKIVRMVSATLQRTEEDGEVLLSGVAEAWREAQVEQFRKRLFWTMSFFVKLTYFKSYFQ